MKQTSRSRIIATVVTAFVGAFLAVSVASFDPADPPSEAVYPPNDPVRNWCGGVGAYVAYILLSAIGDAAYPLLLFVMTGALLWISNSTLEDKAFRIIGGALLVLSVSVASAMITVEARMPEGNGGVLGLAIWMYLEPRLGVFGTVLLMVPVAVVGLVLLTDTWLIILPVAVFKWVRSRAKAPYNRIATAAIATAGAAGARIADYAGTAGTAEAEPLVRVRKQRRPRPKPDGEDEDEAPHAAQPETATASGLPLPTNVVIRHTRKAKPTTDGEKKEFAFTPPASTPRNQEYRLPPVDLLQDPEYTEEGEDEEIVREKAEILTETLHEFGVSAKVVAIETGPVITQYELALAPGIKVGKVIALSDDLAIALKAPNVRIVAPLPGKDTIGVEVPNTGRQIVRLKEIVLAATGAPKRMGLPLFLGKDSSGDPLVKDLSGMPHLLIAGTTGSGKSVCLNAVIMSLLLTRTPDDLRLVLIDPKMVELSVFKRLPHLLCPVVNDMRKAEAILGWLVERMEDRYHSLSKAGVRDIASYNRLPRDKLIERFQPADSQEEARIEFHMPHICVIVDELADLMMVAAKEVEGHVIRLSQKSRAVGIHLVMATQRPSVDVLTGLIKANLPVRISFQVATRIDSRTILDSMGAEKLLGQGDMLFMTPGASKFARAQGAYVSDQDIHEVLEFITEKAEPEFQRELVQLKANDDGQKPAAGDESLIAVGADDELYNEAIEVVLQYERGSVSLLQRRLGIGYGRAARLIDQMAEDGIVGEYKGSQAREVLLTLEQWEALKARRGAGDEPDTGDEPDADDAEAADDDLDEGDDFDDVEPDVEPEDDPQA
ncbi:MAG TPA: DNA translocase FtsK [Phycisphaerae bacterium]|nr:DNA translocase FtsK [Phycisphaerae bacterium]